MRISSLDYPGDKVTETQSIGFSAFPSGYDKPFLYSSFDMYDVVKTTTL